MRDPEDSPDAEHRNDGGDEEQVDSILDEEPETDSARGDGKSGALESLVDGIREAGEDGSVSIQDILDTFAHRSVGALVSVVSLLAVLPVIGGIPGMSMTTATIILLIIGQSLFHKSGGLWVPGFIGRRKMQASTVDKVVAKVRPYVRRADGWMRPRLEFLTHGRPQRLVTVIAIVLLSLTFYPAEMIPWSVTAPSLGVLMLGLSLMSGDGLLALFGYGMVAATVGIGAVILLG